MTDTDLLDSAQVAERLGVSVVTVYKLRGQHPQFPAPVMYIGNSPRYSSTAIDEFIVARSRRDPSARGRRPRLVARGVVDEDAFSERLRRAIANGDDVAEITTQAQLIERLGLNIVTFGRRMRGETRWKDAELALIAELLHIDVTDANDAVDAARNRR